MSRGLNAVIAKAQDAVLVLDVSLMMFDFVIPGASRAAFVIRANRCDGIKAALTPSHQRIAERYEGLARRLPRLAAPSQNDVQLSCAGMQQSLESEFEVHPSSLELPHVNQAAEAQRHASSEPRIMSEQCGA